MASDKRILVFHGNDPFVIRQKSAVFLNEIPAGLEDMAFIRLSGDKCELSEAIGHLSMPAFGSPVKVVWIKDYQKLKNKNAVQQLVDVMSDDVRLILEQEEVKPPSATLAKIFNSRKDVELLLLYPPDEREVKRRVNDFFKRKELSLKPELISFMVGQLVREPQMLESELEKIELFLSNQTDLGKITEEELAPLLSAEMEGNLFLLIEQFLSGNRKNTIETFLHLFHHSGDMIPFVALLTNELYRRVQYLEGLRSGASSDELLNAIGVFHFRAKENFKREKPAHLDKYYGMLRESLELETILKTDSLSSEGFDQVRISLPARAHFLKMLFYFSKPLPSKTLAA